MSKQPLLVAITPKQLLTLLLIFLSACTPFTGATVVPSEIFAVGTVTSTMNTTPIDTLSPASAATLTVAPPAGTGTDSIILQQTGTPTARVQEVVTGTCQLELFTQPPWPEKTFAPNELDGESRLHITGRPQQINLATYRLQVTGLVDYPLSLTYDELRCMPEVTDNPELVCPGVFTDRASWTGVPIPYILELAGVQQGASQLTLVSADGYQVKLPLNTASMDESFLAYEVNGKTLPVQHGFPLRAVFPSMWGSYWLKWLVEIRIS